MGKETKSTVAEKPVKKMGDADAMVATAVDTDMTNSEKSKGNGKKYFEAVGRRKRAVARVRIFTVNPKDSAAEGNFIINDKNVKDYFFNEPSFKELAYESLSKLKASDHFKITVQISGGGTNAQAEAIRLGIARALVKFDLNFRKKLKKSGLLSRDPREKERRKYGLKKARRAPQFSKR